MIELPPLVSGAAPAPFMLIGQAPGRTDQLKERLYSGPAAMRLFSWLYAAGFTEADIGTTVYMTALTKCFPGRLPCKSVDRAPSRTEMNNCRPWLDRQLALVQPDVIILFGKMAIDTFLGGGQPLEQRIGKTFTINDKVYIPLPHSSGASTWLNGAENKALLAQAIERVREERAKRLLAP